MTTELYKIMKAEQQAAGEKSDCTVKALAIAAGVNYNTAKAALKRNGREDGRGTKKSVVMAAAKELGKTLVSVNPKTFINKYPGIHKNLANVTTHHPERFHGVWEDGRAYIAFTKDHALAIVNGVTHDWTAKRSLRVKSLYRVN